MNALAQVIAERDQAQAEAAALREVLKSITDDDYRCPGETGTFTKQQIQIVCMLKKASGRYASRAALIQALYFDKGDDAPFDKTIDVAICKIRKRLKNHRIETFWGVGWRLVPLDEETNNA